MFHLIFILVPLLAFTVLEAKEGEKKDPSPEVRLTHNLPEAENLILRHGGMCITDIVYRYMKRAKDFEHAVPSKEERQGTLWPALDGSTFRVYLLPDGTCVFLAAKDKEGSTLNRLEMAKPETQLPTSTAWLKTKTSPVQSISLKDHAGKNQESQKTIRIGMSAVDTAQAITQIGGRDCSRSFGVGVSYEVDKPGGAVQVHSYSVYDLPDETLLWVWLDFKQDEKGANYVVSRMELGNKGEGYPGKLKWFEMKKESPKEITLAEFVELKQPIHQAVKAADLEGAKRLLAADPANANLKGRDDMTPLHRAVMAGNIEMIELLAKNKANPNARKTLGYTPLHLAVIQRDPKAVACLMTYDADPWVKNDDGEYAFDLAKGDPKLIELLTKAKSKE